jgi:hypothetical protein
MQTALSSMNVAFSAEGVDSFGAESVEAFRPDSGNSLAESLRRHPGVTLDDAILAFIDTFPTALTRAVQAIIWENANRRVTVPITFAWQPGYDYSITVHDVSDTPKTRGGITIVFTSRYPGDPHPLNRRATARGRRG